MAGFIRYKLPGDKPRRRAERQRGVSGGEWNPPPVTSDTDTSPTTTPRYSTASAALAAGGSAAAVLIGGPFLLLWGFSGLAVIGGALAVAVVVFFAMIHLRAKNDGTREVTSELELRRTGLRRVYRSVVNTLVLGALAGWLVWNTSVPLVIPLSIWAVMALAFPGRAWLRHRRFKRIADEADADLLGDAEW